MMNQSPVSRVTEIVPREAMQQPFGERAIYDNIKRFVLLGAPVGIGTAVSFGLSIAVWETTWLVATFAMIGFSLLCVMWLVLHAYMASDKDFTSRRSTHSNVILQVVALVQHITVQQFNLKSGAVLNQTGTGDITNNIVASDNTAINETYTLALHMASVAVSAWLKNGNKRPRPKPYSAGLMTEQLHIGRDRWGELVQYISDAKVISRPETATWTPLVRSVDEARELLDKHTQSLGYLKTRVGQKETWIKK